MKPYVERNKIEYLIAYGDKAAGYPARGIPAAWLVNAEGKIVWQGHPGSLNQGMIEPHLKDAKVPPRFDFEGDLAKAGALVGQKKYGKAVAAFEKSAEGSDDAEVAERARGAIAEILAYGEWAFGRAEAAADEGDFPRAMKKLQQLSASYKGTPVGDRAEAKFKEWRKDKRVKAELEGADLIARADELAAKGDYKNAARALSKVSTGKKYQGTKAQERAEAKLEEVMRKL